MKKILVTDDDPDILDLVQYIREKAGFEVHTYNSGFGAEAKIAACNPNVILLDIQLPGKSGVEICKEIKKTNVVPVILFSANAHKQRTLAECKVKLSFQSPSK